MSTTRSPNKKRIKELQQLADSSVSIGWFPGEAPYPDGKTVSEVAWDNEFGNKSRHVPQRSFLRTTIHEKRTEWFAECRALAGKGLPLPQVMEQMGLKLRGDFQTKVRRISEAGGNSPETIERKGFDAPLVDTARMVQSMSHRVDEPQ